MQVFEYPLLKEKFFQGCIQDLKLTVVIKKGFLKKYALLGVEVGSHHIEFEWQGKKHRVPLGIAHFLEHLLFEQEEGNAFTQFASQTASTNAYTSHSHTAYLFSCTHFFQKNLKLLLDFVFQPYFPKEVVEKEKGVIGEEIKMEADHSFWKCYHQLLQGLFVHHPVREEIAGTLESIQQIDSEKLELFYKAFYQPPLMHLILVGDLEVKEIQDFLNTYFQQKEPLSFDLPKPLFPKEPKTVSSPKVSSHMDISEPYFLLGYKYLPESSWDPKTRIRQQTALNLALNLLFSKRTAFYTDLYDSGLILPDFTYHHMGEKDYEFTIIGGTTQNPNMLEERLVSHIHQAKAKGFSSQDFEILKRKTLGSFLSGLDSVSFVATQFLEFAFWGLHPLDYLDLLDSIQIAEVWESLEILEEPSRSVSIIHPLSK